MRLKPRKNRRKKKNEKIKVKIEMMGRKKKTEKNVRALTKEEIDRSTRTITG